MPAAHDWDKIKRRDPDERLFMDKVGTDTWEMLKQNDDAGVRNMIIAAYMGLVYCIARGKSRDFGHYADYEELVSYGTMGLIDAVKNYDHNKGVRFEAYAAIRIRGAIIDAIRKKDWMPRNVRKRYEAIEQYSAEWHMVHGKTPSDEQIAQGLEISVGRVVRAKSRWIQRSFVSIEWAQEYGGCCVVEQDDHVIPENALINKEMLMALEQALDLLPKRQRQIVTLSYFQGLTLKMIGNVLNVSESRVSQLRAKAIKQLRQTMQD